MQVFLAKYISGSLCKLEEIRGRLGISNTTKDQLVSILSFVGQEAKLKVLRSYVYKIKDVCVFL